MEVVNSQKFIDVFKSCHPQFNKNECKCCVVVSTNELSYVNIFLANLFPNFLNFRGRPRIHNGTERMPAK